MRRPAGRAVRWADAPPAADAWGSDDDEGGDSPAAPQQGGAPAPAPAAPPRAVAAAWPQQLPQQAAARVPTLQAFCLGILGRHVAELSRELGGQLGWVPAQAKAALLAVARRRGELTGSVLAALADPEFTSLDLSGCRRLFAADVLAVAPSMPAVRVLDVQGFERLLAGGWRRLAAAWPGLEVLRLGGSEVASREALRALPHILPGLPTAPRASAAAGAAAPAPASWEAAFASDSDDDDATSGGGDCRLQRLRALVWPDVSAEAAALVRSRCPKVAINPPMRRDAAGALPPAELDARVALDEPAMQLVFAPAALQDVPQGASLAGPGGAGAGAAGGSLAERFRAAYVEQAARLRERERRLQVAAERKQLRASHALRELQAWLDEPAITPALQGLRRRVATAAAARPSARAAARITTARPDSLAAGRAMASDVGPVAKHDQSPPEGGLAALFMSADAAIQRRRTDNIFKQLDERSLTDDEQRIIHQRVELQRRLLEEYEKREQRRKVGELRDMFPELAEAAAQRALDLCGGKEDDAVLRLTEDAGFRRRVMFESGTALPVTVLPRPAGAGGGRLRPDRHGPAPSRLISPSKLEGSVFVGRFRSKLGPYQLQERAPLDAPAAAAAAAHGKGRGKKRKAAPGAAAEPAGLGRAATAGAARAAAKRRSSTDLAGAGAAAAAMAAALDEALADATCASDTARERSSSPGSDEQELGSEGGEDAPAAEPDGRGGASDAAAGGATTDCGTDTEGPALAAAGAAAAGAAAPADSKAAERVTHMMARQVARLEPLLAAERLLEFEVRRPGASSAVLELLAAEHGRQVSEPIATAWEVLLAEQQWKESEELAAFEAAGRGGGGSRASSSRGGAGRAGAGRAAPAAVAAAAANPDADVASALAAAAALAGGGSDASVPPAGALDPAAAAAAPVAQLPPRCSSGLAGRQQERQQAQQQEGQPQQLTAEALAAAAAAAKQPAGGDEEDAGAASDASTVTEPTGTPAKARLAAATSSAGDSTAEPAAGQASAGRRPSRRAAAGAAAAVSAHLGAGAGEARGGRGGPGSRGGSAISRASRAISETGHTCRGRVRQKSHKTTELVEVGQLVPHGDWHNAGYIFPAGFRSRLLFRSSVDLDALCLHECEILGAGGRFWPAPTFVVTARDREDEPIVAKSCTGCWSGVRRPRGGRAAARRAAPPPRGGPADAVARPPRPHAPAAPAPAQILKRINAVITARIAAGEALPPPPRTAIAGPEYFGLNDAATQAAIEALDPQHLCTTYWLGKEHREAAAAGMPVAVQPLPRAPPAGRAGGGGGGGGGGGRKRGRGRADAADADDEGDDTTGYRGNHWSSISRRERYIKRCTEAGDEAMVPDDAQLLPGVLDPVTLEPVVNPAISPAGHVMGLATWKAVLAESGRCPFTQAPLRADQLTVLSANNIDKYRDRIARQRSHTRQARLGDSGGNDPCCCWPSARRLLLAQRASASGERRGPRWHWPRTGPGQRLRGGRRQRRHAGSGAAAAMEVDEPPQQLQQQQPGHQQQPEQQPERQQRAPAPTAAAGATAGGVDRWWLSDGSDDDGGGGSGDGSGSSDGGGPPRRAPGRGAAPPPQGRRGGAAAGARGDDELYDPDADDADDAWAAAQRQGRPTDAILSCPGCFATLSIDCQQHAHHKNQYRAMFVTNCDVRRDAALTAELEPPPHTRGPRRGKRRAPGDGDDEGPAGGGGAAPPPAREVLHPVCCAVCGTQRARGPRDAHAAHATHAGEGTPSHADRGARARTQRAMWGRGTRSLDLRHSPFDAAERRRSAELGRSTRRYDEHWGAAERADTRLKCGDGAVHQLAVGRGRRAAARGGGPRRRARRAARGGAMQRAQGRLGAPAPCHGLAPGRLQRPGPGARRGARPPRAGAGDGPEQQQERSAHAPPALGRDPEASLRSYGRLFGQVFKLPAWIDEAPRVRVRTIARRQMDDLVELAVLNERLSGVHEPWDARNRLELLRTRRKNWEHIYDYVTRQDAAATLELIETAAQQAEELLSEESREHASVTELKLQLTDLQAQVDEASRKLRATQDRVEQNLGRVAELKAEAAALERLSQATSSSPAASGSAGALQRQDAAPAPAAAAAASGAAGAAPSRSGGGGGSSSTAVLDGAPPARGPARRSGGRRPGGGARARVDRGLRSSLDAEPALKEFWYPAEFSAQLRADMLVPFELFNEPWVLFRDAEGRPSCIRDECAHRACPLSVGTVIDGKVSCAYHGWEFDGDGSCTKMPSTLLCRNVAVAALPCVEKDGFIWVWPGEGVPPEVPATAAPPPGYVVHAEIQLEVPVEHGLLIENLLDLAHAPFTHQATFAKDWPVPDAVKFHAQRLLSGQWDPYPIDMAFQPPCMTVSKIGLAQPGKIMRGVTADACERHLHQLHVCAPGRRGTTRLLYRMSMDFLGWARHVPGIQRVWKGVAGQVLGEDLKLVLGQQDRLERGGDTWANPVSYDKLAVRYRRWRNGVASGRLPDGAAGGGAAGGGRDGGISMSAGELFRLEESEGFMDEQQQAEAKEEEEAAREEAREAGAPAAAGALERQRQRA
ncbi:hypothetical protein HT031_003240 [Scenedesmus sp. PABB004]|nr:hypothetical protein HT031_003240 [Scenedesmus sp. PABB004]